MDLPSGPLSKAKATQLSELQPSLKDTADRYVRGVVVLIWPFSSATKQFSLLLSDPDFRRRELRGQIKARFAGPSAEAVAKSKIGIGDIILLGLDGLRWEEHASQPNTPGTSIEWDLLFSNRLVLEVCVYAQGPYLGS